MQQEFPFVQAELFYMYGVVTLNGNFDAFNLTLQKIPKHELDALAFYDGDCKYNIKVVPVPDLDPNSIKLVVDTAQKKVVGQGKIVKQTKHTNHTPAYLMGQSEPQFFCGGPGYTVTEIDAVMQKGDYHEHICAGATVYLIHDGLVSTLGLHGPQQYPMGFALQDSPPGASTVIIKTNQVN